MTTITRQHVLMRQRIYTLTRKLRDFSLFFLRLLILFRVCRKIIIFTDGTLSYAVCTIIILYLSARDLQK